MRAMGRTSGSSAAATVLTVAATTWTDTRPVDQAPGNPKGGRHDRPPSPVRIPVSADGPERDVGPC